MTLTKSASTYTLVLLLVTSFLSSSEALTKPSGIKLLDNQYTGIVVAIHEDEQENSELIDSIKRMFVRASSYLYTATKKRVFFKEVTILIPSSWSDDISYGTVRNESFLNADVIIAPRNPRFAPDEVLPPPPYTKHYGGCGKQGIHIHFTSRFLLDRSLEDIYGDFGRLLVHEWGQFRWGLFNEYPDDIEDGRCSEHFYLSPTTGLYEPVACPQSWNMSAMKYTGIHSRPLRRCNGNRRDGYEKGCLSVAEHIQPNFTASIMMNKHLSFEQIIHFCDNDTEDEGTLHNSEADNKHNRLCGGRSSWEVMREHDDFRGDRNPPRDVEDVRPTFRMVRENEAGQPIVLVLDTSGSMATRNRSKRLQSVARSYLTSTVAHGCRVGLVDFDSTGKILSHLREINSETTRQELAGLIVGDHIGGTCIGCGVSEALKIIPENQSGKIILITDGKDSKVDDLLAAQSKCIRRGVVVDSIAYSDMAQANLRLLSETTGGKFYLQTDDPRSRGALQAYSENSDCGRQRTSSRRIAVFSSVYTLAAGDAEVSGTVEIDPTIGSKTKFIFSYYVEGNVIQVELFSPRGRMLDSRYTGYKEDLDSKMITVNILGTAEAGTWQFIITSRSAGSYDVTVFVSSLPATEGVPPIEIRSYLSGTEVEVIPKTPLIAITEVKQGLRPIVNARVIATVERPESENGLDLGPVEIILKDDGIGFDVSKDDGIYTRAFTNFTGTGFYGVSVRVESDSETALWNGTSFNASSFESVNIKTPNFNRESSSGASYVARIPDRWTPECDVLPPSKILDLAVTYADLASAIVNITCSSPGGDLDSGRASSYVILRSNSSEELKHSGFSCACAVDDGDVLRGNLSSPSVVGSKEDFSIRVPMQEGQQVTIFFFAVFAVDESGNKGEISNVVQATLRNDTFQAREEIEAVQALLTRDEVAAQPQMTTRTMTTNRPLTPTAWTQDNNNFTTANIHLTMGKESITVTTTDEKSIQTQQVDQTTNSEGAGYLETQEDGMMMTSRKLDIDTVTKSQERNVSAMTNNDTQAITDVKFVSTLTATSPDESSKTEAITYIDSTIRPNEDSESDATSSQDITLQVYSNTNIKSTIKPDAKWRADKNARNDATTTFDMAWKTVSKTTVASTISPDAEWKSGPNTHIDLTIRPDAEWKTDAKTDMNAPLISDTEWTTDLNTNIDPTTRFHAKWKTDAKTNMEAPLVSDTEWTTDLNTNIDPTTRFPAKWNTDAKTNMEAPLISDTEWTTDLNTNIDPTTRFPAKWNTDAKTNMEEPLISDTEWTTDLNTNIYPTTRFPTKWKTDAKTNMEEPLISDTEWTTDLNTNIYPTTRFHAKWKTDAKKNVAGTIGPDAYIDSTIEPHAEWEPNSNTHIYPTVNGLDKISKTDGRKNTARTTYPDAVWKSDQNAYIDSTIRPVAEWNLTDAITKMDTTNIPNTDWRTDSKIYVDAEIGFDRSEIDEKTKMYPKNMFTSSKTDATAGPQAERKIDVRTTSSSDAPWKTYARMEIGATMIADTASKLDSVTTSYGTMHRTLPSSENTTDFNPTMATGCETKFGWLEFNKHCYKLLYQYGGKGHNFTTMLTACKEEGSRTFGKNITRVVDIKSKEENDFVAGKVAQGIRAWIGAKRDGNGLFRWKIGDGDNHDEVLDGYANWKPNEPNNKWNQELCVEINRGPRGGWNDIKCKRRLPIICKYSLSSLGK